MKRSTGVRAALLVLAAGAGAGVLLALARNVHGSGRTVALAGRRAMLGRARMCLSLLATEPELSHARPWTVLHKCMRQVKKTVEKWKTCDECVECKNTGSDCGLCADVARGKRKGTYSSAGGGKGDAWDGDDDIDADFKGMEDFFNNDPIFQDIIKNDPDFKKDFFGGGGPMPPGSVDNVPLTPKEEAELKKFEDELKKAIAEEEAFEAEEKAKKGGGAVSAPAQSTLPIALASAESAAGLPLPLSNVPAPRAQRPQRNSMHWLD